MRTNCIWKKLLRISIFAMLLICASVGIIQMNKNKITDINETQDIINLICFIVIIFVIYEMYFPSIYIDENYVDN